MGFFSSRKYEEDSTPSVVKVLRSTFSPKPKTAQSSLRQPAVAFHAQGTASAILSPPPPPPSGSKSVKPSKSTPFLSVQTTSRDKDRTITKRKSAADTLTPSSPVKSSHDASSVRSSGSVMQSPRKPTDNVTITLAQRLNELAAANAEGLLNDDEYRLLRQDLFERFATKSAVPTEKPVVPVSPLQNRPLPRSSESRTSNVSSRPSSQFIVDVPTTPSRSKATGRSSVSDLFRRPNGHTRDHSDTSSVQSGTSLTPNRFSRMSRMMTRNASSESLGTDAMSISSRTGAINTDGSSSLSSPSRTRGRSLAGNSSSSLRGAPPPSSFHARGTLSEHSTFSGTLNSPSDDEKLQSSQQIKEEIAAIEAERRRLADAFNGLELSTLTKRQRHPVGMGLDDVAPGSTYTLIPESKLRRVNGLDSDGMSVTSDSTSASGGKSTFSGRTGLRGQISGSFRSSSIRRKNSMSSMSSGRYAASSSKSGLAPPLPPFSSQLGHLGIASNSSLNLGRSTGNLPMMSVPEDEVRSLSSTLQEAEMIDAEMEEIRRRRDEVSKRYDARLDYLRAKLKGAQLHEKLKKK